MNRLLVFLLAAFDAIVAAAVGVAVILAPLTLTWVIGFSGEAPWTALWPATARIWQLGHLVPLEITLPSEYLVATGIPSSAAHFFVSLAPLAFTGFVLIFSARSGRRAARAGDGITGVLAGSVVFAIVALGILLTSSTDIATVEPWHAVLFPAAIFFVGALVGAVRGAWEWGDDGPVDAFRDAIDASPGWRELPGAIGRGVGISLAGFIGVGALALTVAIGFGAGQIIALYESARVDALGATLVTFGLLAYLPTLIVWSGAYVAGPGFALGGASVVSPAGTDVGVLPGIPLLGAIPAAPSMWFLLMALALVGVGVLAGWRARAVIAADTDSIAVRAVAAVAIAALAAGGVALFAFVASGGIGPGRMAALGPHPGFVALAVGGEILVGAAIVLLLPSRRRDSGRPTKERRSGLLVSADADPVDFEEEAATGSAKRRPDERASWDEETEPIEGTPASGAARDSAADGSTEPSRATSTAESDDRESAGMISRIKVLLGFADADTVSRDTARADGDSRTPDSRSADDEETVPVDHSPSDDSDEGSPEEAGDEETVPVEPVDGSEKPGDSEDGPRR